MRTRVKEEQSLKRKLAAIQQRIAKARDQLREEESALEKLLSTASAVQEDVSEALIDLKSAIERLSQQQ